MPTKHRCWVYGDNVNTDVIFAGKYTYTLKTPDEIAKVALEDLDPTFASAVKTGDVIVAGKNWGCGSSREQGVTALKYAGVSVIIAKSFSRIYFRNCINQGVLPIVNETFADRLQTGDEIELEIEEGVILCQGEAFQIPRLSPSVQAILDAGGLVPMLQLRFKGKIEAITIPTGE